MTVLFEATHIVNVVEVTPDLKQYYENLIAALREKHDLHMTVERFTGIDENPEDARFVRQ